MGILWLFDTTGMIIGPIMWLTGLVALVLCLRASTWARNLRAARVALATSSLPLLAGLCAIPFGVIVMWSAGQLDALNWGALVKACLAGLVVAAVPLIWSFALLRNQRIAV